MSSILNDYVQLEQHLKDVQAQLDKLQNDGRLKVELEFKSKLEALMDEFEKTAKDVIALLDPKGADSPAAPPPSGRRKRKLKIYRHPKSGEMVKTRGGNQKTLKAWKEEFGSDTVESWLIGVEE